MPAIYSPFPSLEAVPKFRNAVYECAGTVQAPLEMGAIAGLSAMAIAIQAGFDVRAPYGPTRPTALAALSVGPSGERKDGLTSYFNYGLGQLRRLLSRQYKEAHREWKVKHTIWKKKRKRIESAIDKRLLADESIEFEEAQLQALQAHEPVEPVEIMLVLEDATPAALAEQMDKSGGSVAAVSPEGAAFLFGKTSENLALINTAWSGSPVVIARKKAGNIEILNPRLTCLILVQPSVIAEYMSARGAKSRGIGFWARFLICCPLSTQGYRPLDGSVQPTKYRDEFAERIFELAKESMEIGLDATRERYVVALAKAADFRWTEIANAIEVELRVGGRFEFAQDHASKLAENILRVAALLHIFEGFEGDISLDTLNVAIGICFYCSGEFLRLFAAPPQAEQDVALIRMWLAGVRNTGLRYLQWNHVRKFGPGALREKQRMSSALEAVVFMREIREFHIGRTRCIDLNPYIPEPDDTRPHRELNLPVYHKGHI